MRLQMSLLRTVLTLMAFAPRPSQLRLLHSTNSVQQLSPRPAPSLHLVHSQQRTADRQAPLHGGDRVSNTRLETARELLDIMSGARLQNLSRVGLLS